jgi:hypothetical protein
MAEMQAGGQLKVLFAYTAQDGSFSAVKGDTVVLEAKIDANWWQVHSAKNKQLTGLMPINYIAPLPVTVAAAAPAAPAAPAVVVVAKPAAAAVEPAKAEPAKPKPQYVRVEQLFFYAQVCTFFLN